MTKQIKTEIIAVGTELLLGQIANTNAQWLSQQLAKYGLNVYYHGVVGDNLTRVEETFRDAQKRSDIIIVTGGLGPTDDDLTREGFQLISNLQLVEHLPAMEKISSFFKKQNTEMTPNNRKQARIFEGAHVLENEKGMAPGMIVHFEEKTWIFLPGVPREMKYLAEKEVFPYLQKMTGQSDIIKSTVLKFIGIGESRLEHELYDLIKNQSNPTIAPLAQNDGVVIRLTVKAKADEEADKLLGLTKGKILDKVGKYYYGADEQTVEEELIGLLKQAGKKIATAESLTGGKFTERLVSVKGASQVCRGGVICYDAKMKSELLGVSDEVIRSFGTVSKECALEMAENAWKRTGSDLGIGFTGVAGPSQMENKPVGTVFIAVSDRKGKHVVQEYSFQGDRTAIRNKAVLKGFEILFNYIKS
ncbi:competence/damage-inducible protein A [Virgibacillus sp. SK37]|uniref:competence/damage-inducible protein A n=1 Tax=Virgibacillus sp. SK37 TaxID=403957 RepID=UPI0004D1805C|nr:competence/damage-inducible protein A [Virgibacillus sp. SK37]AIF43692.1 damage-inducible protein [Virgibacillus sp. SK37]